MRVFISAASAEFEDCRKELRSDLAARGHEVRVQEDFQQGPRSLIEKLEAYVAECDCVIALVGDGYGTEAEGDTVPAVDPPRSYTQWEVHFALGERLESSHRAPPKDLYLYFASSDFRARARARVTQTDHDLERQRRFAAWLESTGKDRREFDTPDQLCRYVLRDVLDVSERPPVTDAPTRVAIEAVRDALARGDAREVLSEETLDTLRRHKPRGLDEYRVCRFAQWSQERYRLDERFAQMTVLMDRGPEATGVRLEPRPETFVDLRDVLTAVREPALVLVGPPGSGKSTLLQRLELDLAVDALHGAGESAPITFYVELKSYKAPSGAALPQPRDWLAQRWSDRSPHLAPFDELFRSGKMILLLDALNEISHRDDPDYRARIGAWREFVADLASQAPGTRAIFSCRKLDYTVGLSTPASDVFVPRAEIRPLDDAQVERFLTCYSPDRGPDLWQRLRGSRHLELFRSPYYLKLLLQQPDPDRALTEGRAALFTGFVRSALTRECSVDSSPVQLDGVLHELDRGRIASGTWAPPYGLTQHGPLVPALCGLAFDMQGSMDAGEESEQLVSYDVALERLGDPSLLRAGIALLVLDRSDETDEVSFVHQLLQEYFAARKLVEAPDFTLARTPWRSEELAPDPSGEVEEAPTTGWEETFMLAAAMALDATSFVRELANQNLPLAGRCAAQPDVDVAPELAAWLAPEILARSRSDAADLRARIAAARALGEFGDPRLVRHTGPDGDYLLAPTARIEGGRYSIGSDEGDADERPVHEVEVDTFEMGSFPVTNAEWRCFIEAGGYDDDRWWMGEEALAWKRGEGSFDGPKEEYRELRRRLLRDPDRLRDLLDRGAWSSDQVEAWRELSALSDEAFEAVLDGWYPAGPADEPSYWSNPTHNHPSQPVVGVSWYEANAYCAWLSVQSGAVHRLPTEAEWEIAARGSEGRRYAWGAGFDSTRCNVAETRVRRTTPVGVFPRGDTPAGLMDLTGNVWEWTSSVYGPYASGGTEEPEAGPFRRVVRGGSWNASRAHARCAFRYLAHPVDRYDLCGFRFVRVSPI